MFSGLCSSRFWAIDRAAQVNAGEKPALWDIGGRSAFPTEDDLPIEEAVNAFGFADGGRSLGSGGDALYLSGGEVGQGQIAGMRGQASIARARSRTMQPNLVHLEIWSFFNNIDRLNGTAYSPDLMPVEHLWQWLREVATYHACDATASEL